MAEKTGKRSKTNTVLLLILMGACLALEIWKPALFREEAANPIARTALTRLLAGLFFVVLIRENGYRVISRTPGREYFRAVCLCIPALLVAVNNLPALSLLRGDCGVEAKPWLVLLFLLQCFCVGFFEELAFRGLLLPMVLKKYAATRWRTFWCIAVSSCVFGLYHLFNLLEGAGIGPVIQQVGYSALVGAMCAACMLISGDVVIPVVLHGVYNFCGLVVPTLGGGTWWDTPTVIFTVILSVTVFGFYLIVFVKKKRFRLLDQLGVTEK